MALYYQGSRPVLRGRNSNDNVNPYTGKAGVYSNYSIFNTSQILDGAPNHNHVPGTGRFPYDLQMSRYFTGLEDRTQPLDDPGKGPELTWYVKYSEVITRQGEGAQDIFDDYGHEDRVTSYSLWEPWTYRGVTDTPLRDAGFGHVERGVDAPGTANSFGTLGLFVYHGTSARPLDDPGVALANKPTGNDHAFQRINEHKGVPSSRAL
jgi:hypothetical protein